MRLATLIILLSSFSIVAQAQNEETRSLASFTVLETGGSWDVILEKGDKEEVRLEGSNIDLDKVITEVKNNELHIYLEKGNYNNIRLKVYVTYQNLEEIHKSGSGNLINKSDLSASDFELHLSGSGNADLRNIDAENLLVNLSGSGNLSMTGGRAQKLAIEQSGSGNVNAMGLQIDDCAVNKSGSGNVEISVSQSLEVVSSGSGNIKYKGSPSINKVEFSGSGKLVKS
ncbi:head GIN domain-containing protein [Catalinimonas niigatensis]|uniref:head GIN domain-containing protein n=1 Tax=Catalinimonas niigatensis TaxID=1397264 RepID=UPI0026658C11|nr:head GIN domain-containing protein [Catalinimonas niigatensis]WPP51374.1 head GIN domain-containing protein [Catalinimonas niigatensis]